MFGSLLGFGGDIIPFIPLILPLIYLYYMVYLPSKYPLPPFKVPKYTTKTQTPYASRFDTLDDIMAENYKKNKNHIYKVEHPHKDVVVLPAKYVEELKALPDSQVSFLEDISERFLGQYTKMVAPGGLGDETLTHTIKNSLTPNIGIIIPAMQEEISHAFKSEVGLCPEWTPMYPMTTLMRIIALVSGRIFCGPSLNRNEEYMSTCLNFDVNADAVIHAIRKYPRFLRPVAQYWVKECREPEKSIATMRQLIKPLVEERKRVWEECGERSMENDMMTWIMLNSPGGMKGKGTDLEWQALYQLQIAAAAIRTTSNTITHIFFDLAAHSEYLSILREEIRDVMGEEKGEFLGRKSMSKLKKMDSFILESQRMNPSSSTCFSRKVLKPTKLSERTVLPPGITFTLPLSQISMDPDIFPDPETFDGLRFSKLREQEGEESKWQYVSTNKDHLSWGYGTHACPGRFFAEHEIKIILIHLLENYEIKLEGEGRPRNIFTEGGMIPDAKGEILLKRR